MIERRRIRKFRLTPQAASHLGSSVNVAPAIINHTDSLGLGVLVARTPGEIAEIPFGRLIDEWDTVVVRDSQKRIKARFLMLPFRSLRLFLRGDVLSGTPEKGRQRLEPVTDAHELNTYVDDVTRDRPTESDEHAYIGVGGEKNEALVGRHLERARRFNHPRQPNLPPLPAKQIQGAQTTRPRQAAFRTILGIDDPRPPIAACSEGVFGCAHLTR